MIAPVEISGTATQLDMIQCTHPYQAWITGRQWGKSHAARNRVKDRLSRIPGFKFCYVVPYYSQGSTNVYFDLVSSDLAPYIVKKKVQPYCQFWLSNGSYFMLRAWNKNPNALRSQTVDEVFFDEIQNATHYEDFWTVLPALVAVSAARKVSGSIIISGQHRGENSWYYDKLFKPGLDPTSKTHKSWQLPSSSGYWFENTPAGKEYLARQKQMLDPVDWAQEFLCIPTANRNAAFKPSDVAFITRGAPPVNPLEGNLARVMGLDIAQHRDHAAIVVTEVRTGLVVAAEEFKKGQPHPETAKQAADIARRWRCSLTVIDATGGAAGGQSTADKVLDHYRKAFRGVCPLRELYWGGRVQQRIVNNAILMVQEALVIKGNTFQLSIPARFDKLLRQLYAYEFHHQRGGYWYGAQDGMHDDLCSAFIMTLWAIADRWVGQFYSNSLIVEPTRLDLTPAKRL